MNYKIQTYGKNTKRRNYQKNELIDLPVFNLLDVQYKSFEEFIKTGIDEIFREIYPIHSAKDKIRVEYIGLKIKMPEKSKYDELINEAKEKGINFSVPISAHFKMINLKEGTVIDDKDAFILNLPIMTEGGSFIINGSERVIVSQIVRSPGVYFEKLKASRAQSTSDSSVYKLSSIIPSRGSWIEFDYRDYKLLNINPSDIKLRIDKSKKLKLVTLLNAFGLTQENIYDIYSNHELIEESFRKITKEEMEPYKARRAIFKVIHSGDRFAKKAVNDSIANLIFNSKRYNLSKTGRYKLNVKFAPKNRILGQTLATDLKDASGNVIFKKDTKINLEKAITINDYWKDNNLEYSNYQIDYEIFGDFNPLNFSNTKYQTNEELKLNEDKIIRNFTQVNIIKIYDPSDHNKIINILSSSHNQNTILTIADIIATVGHFINLEQGISDYDDIDSLSNRKIKSINELLQNQFRIGLIRIEKNLKDRISAKDTSNVTIKNSTNHKLMESVFKEFFNSSQLSQFMDQINPLAELSNKRRITSLGPGGLSRDTASLIVRGIHDTHYGRIDPIETPEGPNIGLILNLAIYAKINEYGILETPYFKVTNGVIDPNSVTYMTVDDEKGHVIAPANVEIKNNKIIPNTLIARKDGQFLSAKKEKITLIDVSTKQIVSIATSHIPFLENNDANRALMGANMQRQAVPLIKTEAPIVGTGIEEVSAKYSPTVLKTKVNGKVSFVNSKIIKVIDDSKKEHIYKLKKFLRSNQASLINQRPIVNLDEKVKIDDIIADGPSIDNGELAIGKNVLVSFTTWRGYNYEDAIIISSRLIKNDTFTSIHIEEHKIEERNTKLGKEKITIDIPNSSKESMRNLGKDGIIIVGSEVKVGDVLVGKVTPKGEDDLSPEDKLLDAILGNKSKNTKDSSLRVPYGAEGIIQDVQIISKENGDRLDDGIEKIVKVFIVQKRKLKEGDKMSGRHGNKGVVSRILPEEDMPYLEDGTPVDVMLNPLGVPSRMNIGQILEVHLGMAAKKLGLKVVTPIFNGANEKDIQDALKEAKLDQTGKFYLFDGITGKRYEDKVTVGIMYMLKLSHMVDDKMHARSIGPYSLITQQPLRGKAQNGGQRFGEMEAWAFEAYGASNLLQEMLTLKSDDIKGRNELYNSIAKGKKLPRPNIPEGFWVLFYELRGLGMDLRFLDENNKEVEIDNSL
ncbi:DNA-directed RNA polymerase subunit beta [Candidatus Hepatoplasma crinochetorum Av]|uniref:DNA-directed RNA polymerase subunit beta n=1 Tax=Candidatus Hepatoplasma crinochetorum Av TaxID=1427984 RepID=W8GK30_9MOLU|nr:DNA-directed RNA polymerase subunit beta [Candidatus Hepatoplasma crinochetorum]AHK22602.1 DNA-directed RNA polymerase subunit beta [Candidatus Hepatoplasma crinochetorum Av]